MPLYHSGLASLIWKECTLGVNRGDSPPVCGLPELGFPDRSLGLLGRRVTPIWAVYSTTIVMVTVTAGKRCTFYGLKGPLNAKQLPPGSGT